MKKIISLLTIGLIFISCASNEDSAIINPPDGISFQIEKTNSTNNYISNSKVAILNRKSSFWSKDHQGELHSINKEIHYDLTLENGETIDFGLWFGKNDPNIDLLILDNTSDSGLSWDYISSQTESVDFYQNSDLRVLVDNNVIFLGNTNTSNLITVETIIVNGEEKNHLTINFNGSARGWYDPNGEYQSVYNITNGVFRGVVE